MPQASNPDNPSSQENPKPGEAEETGVEGGSPPQDANPGSEEPGDKTEEDQPSFADVIQKVLPTEAADAPSKSAEGQDAPGSESDDPDSSKKEAASDDKAEALKDEDGKDLPPFHEHPRWKEDVAEKNQLKEQNEALKQQADFGGVVNDYMTKSGLTDSHLTELLSIGAGALSDPASVIPRVEEFLTQLKTAAGDVLPDDLKSEVDQGYISEDRARELSRLRAGHSRLETKHEQAARQNETRDAQAQAQEQIGQAVNAANQWSAEKQKSDSDFEHRAGFVSARAAEIINTLVQQGKIQRTADGSILTTPQQTMQILDMADQEVTAQLKGLAPGTLAKPEVKASPLSTQTGAAQPGTSPRKDPREAKSLEEAMFGAGG